MAKPTKKKVAEKQLIYAELHVTVRVPDHRLGDLPDDADPFEEPLDQLRDAITQLHIPGLTEAEGVTIEVSE